MKKRILSFFCACLLLFTALSSLGTFATEPESGEGNSEEAQALEAAEAADEFFGFLFNYPLVKRHIENGYDLGKQTAEYAAYEYGKRTGLLEDIKEEAITVGEPLPYSYYPFPATMSSIARWEEEYTKYLTGDFLRYFDQKTMNPVVLEKDGRTYARFIGETHNLFADWSDATCIVNGDTAEVSVLMRDDMDAGSPSGRKTISLLKTDNGWRVNGGTYFYDTYSPALLLPATGDNTPVFLTLTALSVLGLCALAVTVGRKKKERL